jgi:hypothetical protein
MENIQFLDKLYKVKILLKLFNNKELKLVSQKIK